MGPPWLKVSHLVTKQAMLFNTEIKGCKTKDNVTVLIDMSIVLRVMGEDSEQRPGDDPQNVYKFVHEVTPVGLQAQLGDAQAEAVRTLARSVYHTEVFGLRNVCHSELEGIKEKLFSPEAMMRGTVSGDETKDQEENDMEGEHDYYDSLEAEFNVEAGASVTEAMKVRLNQQFNLQGVEILDVIIKDIKLPDTIQSQMSQKTMVISQNAMQRMQQKHDMLSLIQEEEIKTLNQTHQEQRKELVEDGKFERIMEDLKLQTVHAEGDRQIQSIETQMAIDVKLVEVESNLTVQRIQDETKLETERIREQSIADTEIELAKTRADVDIILAKGELDIAKICAKGDRGDLLDCVLFIFIFDCIFLNLISISSAIFEAEGISAPLNSKLNDHTTELLRLKAQYALATNDQVSS
jgi:regulator of protease activity HflC (stomatin/prohibitin superfamily)